MSARKRTVFLSLAGAILLIAVIYSMVGLLHQTAAANTTILKSGGKQYTLILAATQAQQQRGLGERSFLPQNKGMLFIFQQSGTQCFWMKDMHFPLDMIWLSRTQRVEYIKSNVSPNTYPNTFCPNVSAKYVIELNAGQAQVAGIHDGQLLSF